MENLHNIDFKAVGERIKKARKEKRLTQEKAAEKAFITGQFWCLIETGRERASVNTYRQIAAILDLTLDDIFYEASDAIHLKREMYDTELFSECTELEKTILSEVSLAIKEILLKNRR